MKSIKDIYRIGVGPSSSHTMGPKQAAQIFKERHTDAFRFKVTLYGSLAATGKGHLTDVAIREELESVAPVQIVWQPKIFLPYHPNGMNFCAYDKDEHITEDWTVYSVGGGALETEEGPVGLSNIGDIYPMTMLSDIQEWCERTGRSYWEYVAKYEDEDIWDYLHEVWNVMKEAIKRGLDAEGVLPGPLNLRRKAINYYIRAKGYQGTLRSRGMVFAYALAVSEENAAGGKIVTAPTCGSCGVLPAVLYSLHLTHDFSEIRILRALATAGLIGNIVKENASIAGADVGCQGEVGVACAMASAMVAWIHELNNNLIAYAAEMGLEHNFGLTCDPVGGYVQIPCIERNAYAALRAMDAGLLAGELGYLRKNKISFDQAVRVLKATGKDLNDAYKETSLGGLAKEYHVEND